MLRLALYPVFYLVCLLLFVYWTFPWERVKDRLIAEFDRMQEKGSGKRTTLVRGGLGPMRLEIGELDGYWLSGVEVEHARLVIPPSSAPKTTPAFLGGAPGDGGGAAAKPTVLDIARATVRVRLLPLLLGRVRIDFSAAALGGTVEGSLPYGEDAGAAELEIKGIDLGQVELLRQKLHGLPVKGVLGAVLALEPREGRFSKSTGKLALRVEEVVLGDGVTKLAGVPLPAAHAGALVLEAAADGGELKIVELGAHGRDLEVSAEGRVKLQETWARSEADIYLKFRFTEAYRGRDENTRALLESDGKLPPAIELDPTFRKARREDGFYGFYIYGPLGDLKFEASPSETTARAARGKARAPRKPQTTRAPFPVLKGVRPSDSGPASPPIPTPPPAPAPAAPAPERSPERTAAELAPIFMPTAAPAEPEPAPPPAPEPSREEAPRPDGEAEAPGE
jgi:type II secretion system protein N